MAVKCAATQHVPYSYRSMPQIINEGYHEKYTPKFIQYTLGEIK